MSKRILMPLSATEKRMRELAKIFGDPKVGKLDYNQDINFRIFISKLEKRIPSYIFLRANDGSGFTVSETLRHFFGEYSNRLINFGFNGLPSSFRIVESFLEFSRKLYILDIRQEKEHLLRLSDYFDWYTSANFPEEPMALIGIMEEGVIYSYNFISPSEDYQLSTSRSQLLISGVAIVRHNNEVSILAICGENPAQPSDDEVRKFQGHTGWESLSGKEGLEPAEGLDVSDRYLPEASSYSRVLLMAQVDVASKKYQVRYVNQDAGPMYLVHSDDPYFFSSLGDEVNKESFAHESSVVLSEYGEALSSLFAMIYLPIYFITERDNVIETSFSTNTAANRNDSKFKKALKRAKYFTPIYKRVVSCMKSQNQEIQKKQTTLKVSPPEFELSASGYWKNLPPNMVGEDKSGLPIVGKTWVQRTETWRQHTIGEFSLSKSQYGMKDGDNPGWVYVMRSPSHGQDLYKIGLTRRNTTDRAKELSSTTSAPLPFEVLASWYVGDVVEFEREAHDRLIDYRINKRREFFRAPLQKIISVLQKLASE